MWGSLCRCFIPSKDRVMVKAVDEQGGGAKVGKLVHLVLDAIDDGGDG